jgi:predicted DCC family thiol-disulfide oxidoreductase YuxK
MNTKPDYSYREDQNVPDFDDSHPVMIFDGVCVLCSGGAAKLIKWDKKGVFRFTTAQSRLGHALLEHYGCDTVSFNTVLLVAGGQGYTKSDAYLETARQLGGLWKILTVFRFTPKFIRDPLYDWKARNRYNWFGKTEYCTLIPQEVRDRFLEI